MPLEDPRRGEFTELVADHIFRNIYRDMLFAIVNSDGESDEIRRNSRSARPRLDRSLVTGRPRGFYFLLQMAVYERALFYGT